MRTKKKRMKITYTTPYYKVIEKIYIFGFIPWWVTLETFNSLKEAEEYYENILNA